MAKVSVDDFVSALKEWTVVDVMNAIKAIETEFGVAATAPVEAAGATKMGATKVVRETTGRGLKKAKDLVDQAPKPVKQGVNREEAEGVLKKLKDAGAGAEIKEADGNA